MLYVAEWCDDLAGWPAFVRAAPDRAALAAALATLLAQVHRAGFACSDPRQDLGIRTAQQGGRPVVVRASRMRRARGRLGRRRDLEALLEGLPEGGGGRQAAGRAYRLATGGRAQ